MTFEEALRALQELVGEDVMVNAVVAGADPPLPVIALSGSLRKAEPAPSQEVLERMGRATPGDEALMFHVGGTDDPAEKNYFVVRKSGFSDADWEQGPFGERLFSMDVSGLRLNIVSREEAQQHVPRSS